jgi:exopolysaccharide biosynthesis protein
MKMKIFLSIFFFPLLVGAQETVKWINMDSAYGLHRPGVHLYFTSQNVDTAKFRAFYIVADLKNKKLSFTTDTSSGRRLTPKQFYEKDGHRLVVVNGSFFSFETNRNLNVIIKDGHLVSYNEPVALKGKDTLTYRHYYGSAIGISKKRTADVAWTYSDSTARYPYALQNAVPAIKDSIRYQPAMFYGSKTGKRSSLWKMQTAMGGGPVLVQCGEIKISNNEEMKFAGKAINDKHPRTAMGYTKDNRLIILVIQGRHESASGATLVQVAQILKDLGCVEALNLDGGGSSCMLVNGKETIKPSDKEGERPVPGVFLVNGEW